jgi:hypothetical protein
MDKDGLMGFPWDCTMIFICNIQRNVRYHHTAITPTDILLNHAHRPSCRGLPYTDNQKIATYISFLFLMANLTRSKWLNYHIIFSWHSLYVVSAHSRGYPQCNDKLQISSCNRGCLCNWLFATVLLESTNHEMSFRHSHY